MRKNCEATKDSGESCPLLEFEGVGKAGAPVSQHMVIIEKGDNPYSGAVRPDVVKRDFTL